MNGSTTILINGQTVGLKFAFPAIKWFKEESEKKPDIYFVTGDSGGFTVEGLAKLIECSYKNHCLIKETEPTLLYENFYEYVEESQETEEGQKELTRITKVYADSSVMKRLVENIENQKKSQSQ
jgi:hypothetical protein